MIIKNLRDVSCHRYAQPHIPPLETKYIITGFKPTIIKKENYHIIAIYQKDTLNIFKT